ncbi:hypothetical protein L5515_010358 [Caenorhabditis briggsae]|uniref:ELM2 domain-containing protein n=1 Tax=Caenorhabditis briggsae TaxID=6238 RepID=A0AAE9JE07_CAEBR|nr:hypothetical protein L5515_010358 [Caenorhabditis briggsae]
MNSGKSLQKAGNSVKIGPEHQADLDSFTPKATDEMEREELMWTPPTRDMDYQKLKHYYLDPVWRQFGGQVSMEVGLQNLMECGYDQAKALDTIDKKLRDLPQRFKPLARIQMQNFEKLITNEKTEVPLRTLQERAMRTYHIAEVQQFRCAMENHKMGIKNREHCLCPIVKTPEVSPRWCCSNCTEGFKDPSTFSLCLICQAYRNLTGKTRPAVTPLLHTEDIRRVVEWKNLEKEYRRKIMKEELEQILNARNLERLMRNELTDEERDIIETRFLPHRGKELTEIQMRENGQKMEEMLKPTPLPSSEYRIRCCKASQEVVKIRESKRENDDESKENKNTKRFKKIKILI